jgi:arylsulfatase A-like enzyme
MAQPLLDCPDIRSAAQASCREGRAKFMQSEILRIVWHARSATSFRVRSNDHQDHPWEQGRQGPLALVPNRIYQLIGHPDFVGKSTQRGGLYADIIGEMDYRIGQILDAVKEAGIDDNTIVILSSDNASGGAMPQLGATMNGPWRGDFLNTPFEGSMRVPGIIRWPGKIPAGVVTNEMLAAVDWLPTLAGMVGASKLVPRDRPIDGVDASAFMLGNSDTTGRDSYMFFGMDGELLSIKWKIYKTIFRYTEAPALEKPYIAPQFPMFYDLTSDPHEDNNLFNSDMTCGWILAPCFKLIGEYRRSVQEYPNIKVGEEFQGYKK